MSMTIHFWRKQSQEPDLNREDIRLDLYEPIYYLLANVHHTAIPHCYIVNTGLQNNFLNINSNASKFLFCILHVHVMYMMTSRSRTPSQLNFMYKNQGTDCPITGKIYIIDCWVTLQ